MRNKFLLLPLIFILFSCLGEESNRVKNPQKGESLVSSLTGDVQIKRKKSSDWEALRGGEMVSPGQGIRVLEGELYLRTAEGIIVMMGNNTELSYLYNNKTKLSQLAVIRGSISVSNSGADLIINYPYLSLYSQEGIFTLGDKEERLDIYNHQGDLKLLPGIPDLSVLIKLTSDKLQELMTGLPDSQRPLFPGETWFLDENILREQTKKYSELIYDLNANVLTIPQIEEKINQILSMDITITEYSKRNVTSFLKGIDLFTPDQGEIFYRTKIYSDESALITTPYTRTKTFLELTLPENYEIPIEVSKPGFNRVTTTVSPREAETYSDTHFFKLTKMTSRRIAINITPPESEITINGIYAGKGNLVLDLKPDEPLELNVTLEGYNENYLYLDGEKEWPDTIEIELKKTIEKIVRGAYQEVIGLAVDGEDLFVSDWSGIVWYIHMPSGWRRYNTRTDNYPNTLSEPVVTSNYVYLSGKKNLVVMNRLSGATLTVTRLNDRENHLKGQKVVPMDYQILFPTKDSIRFLSGDGTKIREVFIPGGSLMTPALYEGKIYTAATDGQVYEISSRGEILRSMVTEAESPTGQSIIFKDGRGYFSDSRGSVIAFSPQTMTREWKSQGPSEKGNFIYDVMLTDERVYLYGGDKLYTLDRMTGKVKIPLIGSIQTRPLLWGDYIYAMTGEETMTVFSSIQGTPVKSISLGYVITSPLYHFDSFIMAGAYDGNVLIMNQLDPSLLSKPIK